MLLKDDFRFDDLAQMMEVAGVRYAYGVFEAWGENGVELNTHFKLVAREKDGAITIQRIEDVKA